MITIRRLSSWAVGLAFMTATWGWAQEAEKVFKALEPLPAAEREQALVEGAKKEGALTIYFVFARPVMEKLFQQFGEKYPFLDIKFTREGRGTALANRYLMEHRAGRSVGDVVAGGDSAILPLIEAESLAAYRSPEHKHFPKEYMDKHGRWTAAFISKWVFGYNTSIVDRAKLPKTYMDLLDPYWKGKVALDPLPNNFVRGTLKAFGEKKSLDFFHKLLKTQDIQFRRGRTLQTQLLAAGAIGSSPEVRHSLLKQLKEDGAPVDFHFSYPFPVTNGSIGILNSAPHPHAAALFIDYWLSETGQQFMVDNEFTVVREGMINLPPEGIKNMVPLDLDFRKETDEWVRNVAKEVFAKRAKGG